MKNDKGWKMYDEGWSMMISSCWGVLQTNVLTNKQPDICDCRVTFATENDNDFEYGRHSMHYLICLDWKAVVKINPLS